MKTKIGIFTAVLLILSSVILLTFAQDDPDAPAPGEVITGIVSVDGAFVYTGPDFAYRLIGQLPINGAVTITGRRGDFRSRWNGDQWLEIQFGGGTAWVYARLIRTSVPFNSIPPTGRRLPRDRNGRVPEVFDLSQNICNTWQGGFAQSEAVLTEENEIVVNYPTMPGANVYSVIVISPNGFRTAFDSETGTATIIDEKIRSQGDYGTYTWRVAPYWTNREERWAWQQLCLLQTGGTFERVRPAGE